MKRTLAALPLVALTAAFVPEATRQAPHTQDPRTQDPDPVVQDPPEEDEEEADPGLERDIFGRLRSRKPGTKDGLAGMWQLLDADLEGYPSEGLNATGFLLVADGFLSFQMHAYYDIGQFDYEPVEDGYQTFMAEYELVGGDQLKCVTLIGSYLDEEDDILDFEPAGMEREFTIVRKGKLMTLSWEDSSMTFGRRPTQLQRMQDIYGADRGERSREGADIFGREGVRRPGTGQRGDDEDDGR